MLDLVIFRPSCPYYWRSIEGDRPAGLGDFQTVSTCLTTDYYYWGSNIQVPLGWSGGLCDTRVCVWLVRWLLCGYMQAHFLKATSRFLSGPTYHGTTRGPTGSQAQISDFLLELLNPNLIQFLRCHCDRWDLPEFSVPRIFSWKCLVGEKTSLFFYAFSCTILYQKNVKHRIHRLNSAQYYFVMAHFEALAIPQKMDHEWMVWSLSLIGLQGAQIPLVICVLKTKIMTPSIRHLTPTFFKC